MSIKILTGPSMPDYWDNFKRLRTVLDQAEAIVIGAGSGLSSAAGFDYAGEWFEEHFGDFIAKYHMRDMYSGSFYPFATPEEYWAWWSRQIYYNRYLDPPVPVYQRLFELMKQRNYFVITTNVDHCFQKAGFEKSRLFYTQGDYGLWQCSRPCHQATYDNEDQVRRMMAQQTGMTIPSDLVPYCPVCRAPMTMNLRADQTFVQDKGWYQAQARYQAFLDQHRTGPVVYLELGVGMNTPVWIKYPFWQQTAKNPLAHYVCLNLDRCPVPDVIVSRSILIQGDINQVLIDLAESKIQKTRIPPEGGFGQYHGKL